MDVKHMKMSEEVKKCIKEAVYIPFSSAGTHRNNWGVPPYGCHMLQTRSDFIVFSDDETIAWPAAGMSGTQSNLKENGKIQILAILVKDGKLVRIEGMKEAPNSWGKLCPRAFASIQWLYSPQRLKYPLKRVGKKGEGEFERITWDEALNLVAEKLSEIKSAHGPDSMGVLTSARVTNEENYIANKFARAVLKTNNIDHCARL